MVREGLLRSSASRQGDGEGHHQGVPESSSIRRTIPIPPGPRGRSSRDRRRRAVLSRRSASPTTEVRGDGPGARRRCRPRRWRRAASPSAWATSAICPVACSAGAGGRQQRAGRSTQPSCGDDLETSLNLGFGTMPSAASPPPSSILGDVHCQTCNASGRSAGHVAGDLLQLRRTGRDRDSTGFFSFQPAVHGVPRQNGMRIDKPCPTQGGRARLPGPRGEGSASPPGVGGQAADPAPSSVAGSVRSGSLPVTLTTSRLVRVNTPALRASRQGPHPPPCRSAFPAARSVRPSTSRLDVGIDRSGCTAPAFASRARGLRRRRRGRPARDRRGRRPHRGSLTERTAIGALRAARGTANPRPLGV